MDKEDKWAFLKKVSDSFDQHRWSLDAEDHDAALHWAGDLFSFALEAAGISVEDMQEYHKESKNSVEILVPQGWK